MTEGPPPVPGGRTPEEREAARRERAARRAGRATGAAQAPPPEPEPPPSAREPEPPPPAREPEPPPAARDPEPPPPSEPSPPSQRDGAWRDQAERLTEPTPAAVPPPEAERRRPRVGRWVAALLALVALGAAAWFALSLFQPLHGDGEGTRVELTIPQGATLGEIANQLEENGVIRSAGFFELRARLAGRSGELRPGRYELQQDLSYLAALDALEQGVPPNVVQVTVPEGRSRREIAPLVKRLPGNYVRATRRSPLLSPRRYGASGARSLEGFLFPATYELKKGQPVRRLVNKQLTAFKRNFGEIDLSYARRRNLTPYDVLTIASLVEREATLAKERPIIASVIYNRLRQDIRLDIDATTRFAVKNWTQPLKQSEIEDPSPYNTRVVSGLPPGPIGNPGLDSIRAAAKPARTDYIFYVAVICGEGRHRFAATNDEFLRYVNEYEAERERRGGKAPTSC